MWGPGNRSFSPTVPSLMVEHQGDVEALDVQELADVAEKRSSPVSREKPDVVDRVVALGLTSVDDDGSSLGAGFLDETGVRTVR